jgi:arabinan endo-1,5-alpha-L-arabinosidase
MTLESVEGVPFRYRVSIASVPQIGDGLAIRIDDVKAQMSHELVLPARRHKDYKALYMQLSKIFGLRSPRPDIARPVAPGGADHSNDLRLLLDCSIDPRILYGYGDPAVTRVRGSVPGEGNCYYLLVTSNDAPHAFPILRSCDLKEWELRRRWTQ